MQFFSVDQMVSISSAEWMLVFFLWVIAAFTSKRTIRREEGASRIGYMLVLIGSFWLVFSNGVVFGRLDQPFFLQDFWFKATGFVVINAGLAFAVWARIALGTNWSGTVTVKENHELVTTGPYRISRNPIYTGIITAMLGNAFLYGDLKSYVATAFLFCAFLYKISREEKFMIETFGDRYREYSQRVKKIIPLLY